MPDSANGMTLAALAEALGAKLTHPSASVRLVLRVTSLALATTESLVFAVDAPSLIEAQSSAAGAIITTERLAADTAESKPLLLHPEPKLTFARAAQLLRTGAEPTGIHPEACVDPGAKLARNVSVGPFAVIAAGAEIGAGTRIGAGAVIGAECVLGDGCHVYPRVVLYPGVRLGRRVTVHAGAVLGSDGFGYVRDRQTGAYVQFPQQGRLIVEDDVEIGANTTIDRGALEETRIGRGAKIDNLVHVGHNVAIGADVVIAAQTGVSGSSTIGAGAVVAGQVGIADHVSIGEGAILGAQCGVPSHKQIHGPGVLFWGTPARPIAQYLKELATLARLTRGKRRTESE